jgi:hypothetical protein
MQEGSMRRRVLASLLLGFAVANGSCANPACNETPPPSIELTVVDGTGALVEDAQVTYLSDKGSVPAQCSVGTGYDAGHCETWAIFAGTGTIPITVKSADGTKTVQQSKYVPVGECDHPATQHLTIALP